MKIYDKMEQKSDEWFEMRKGKMTASHAQAIGNAGKGLDTYINDLMAEYYSSGEKDFYTNKDMERGNELEEQARELYELQTGNDVKEVGFIKFDEYIGCSPDGLVGEDGGIEIKCLNDSNYFKHLINREKEISSTYIWQIQMNLLITKRKWWDFCAYNPNFFKSLFVHRFYPDEEKFINLKMGFDKGISIIEDIKEKYGKKI